MPASPISFQALSQHYRRQFTIDVDGTEYLFYTKNVSAADAWPYVTSTGEERRKAMSTIIAKSLINENGSSWFGTDNPEERINLIEQLPSPIYFLISGEYIKIIGSTDTKGKSDEKASTEATPIPETPTANPTVTPDYINKIGTDDNGPSEVAAENPS
jgi:hypothetical protein